MLSFYLIIPELFVLLMLCVVLLIDLFIPQRRQMLTYTLTQATLVGAALISLWLYSEKTAVLMHGMLIHDHLTSVLRIVIYMTSIFVFVYSRNYFIEHDMGRGEPYILGLFSILGMMVLVAAHNFLSLYLLLYLRLWF